ncbi:MAG TPA: hypothetical protein VGR28_15275 [Candidatus Thermoplasmatota archaeon]|jgi:hypothetical protein|nr:hypothetical protein [Candidatus Thermoplasmatota archaeon]
MRMFRMLVMLAAGMAVVAPPAAAEWYEGKAQCAEGQACTMSAEEPIAYGSEDCVDCSMAPSDGNVSRPQEDCVDWCPRDAGDGDATYGDCGGEVCAYDELADPGATCMDGEQEGEVCRDDVQYLGGPRGASDAPNPEIRDVGHEMPAKAVPGVSALALVAGLGALALLAARKP